MAAVRTYNPGRVTVIFNGFAMSGFADGTFVAVTMIADGVTSQAGADGEIARAINTDKRCTVTITLQQTSPANLYLSGMYMADVLMCGGRVSPILIQDLCGDTLFAASQAWVTKPADMEFAKEITTREWVLQTGAPAEYLVGGNVQTA